MVRVSCSLLPGSPTGREARLKGLGRLAHQPPFQFRDTAEDTEGIELA